MLRRRSQGLWRNLARNRIDACRWHVIPFAAMTDKALRKALLAHLAETNGRMSAVAAACDVGESTVRFWKTKNKLPRNRFVREALEKFLAGSETK